MDGQKVALALTPDELAAQVDRAVEILRRARDVDAFEVRAEEVDDRQIVVRDRHAVGYRLKRAAAVGVRVFAGGGAGYACTEDVSPSSLKQLINRATALAVANGRLAWQTFPPVLDQSRRATYRPEIKGPPSQSSAPELVDLLQRTEQGAHEAVPDVRVQSSFGARTSHSVLSDSAGNWVETGSLVSTLLVATLARDNGRISDGITWRGGERGVGDYEDQDGPEGLGRDAAQRAHEGLRAVRFPSGRYRVLTDNYLSGTLAHESFGHLAEYDLVSSGWSTLQGRQGERFASENLSICDSPVVENRWKQGVVVPYDDEGTAGRTVRMLDRGVLKEWMHTRDSAAAEGSSAAGNARALNARHAPIVRMRNTYVEPGDHTIDEALEMLGDGLYLIGSRGGAPRSDGSFMFTAVRGYLVEGGEIGPPVRSTAIHGNILDFLRRVEATTSDFEVSTNYFGGCGKGEQSFLHVGIGGPHVLVDGALVGGNTS